ncbi:MAG: mechanosensitive ion channel family protein [Lachnospiraceae bacterium]|nr:mechanosensitive ion channel family protein [Lachnospiraceae bacterium]
MLRLNHAIFKQLQRKKKRLHLLFFENVLRAGIIIFCVIVALSGYEGFTKLYRFIFSGTVVLTGVVGLACQDILKDILAGVLISLCRPFDVGDRVLINDIEKPCVVEDMTVRHVVLKTMDGIRYLIPNSEINNKLITNTSYHQKLRGTFIKIPVAYSADLRKAIEVTRKVVRDCPFTFPNNENNDDLDNYGEVYVVGYDSSSVTLETTIWTEPSMDNFLACSEIRLSIIEAFRKNGVEIPYNYTNVILKEQKDDIQYITPVQRDITSKSDIITVTNYRKELPECLKHVKKFQEFYKFDIKWDTLNLLVEELLMFSNRILPREKMDFWMEANMRRIKFCLQTTGIIKVSKLMKLVNKNKNVKLPDVLIARLRLMVKKDIEPDGWLFDSDSIGGEDDMIEKKLLMAYADSLKIGVIDKHLTIAVIKNL